MRLSEVRIVHHVYTKHMRPVPPLTQRCSSFISKSHDALLTFGRSEQPSARFVQICSALQATPLPKCQRYLVLASGSHIKHANASTSHALVASPPKQQRDPAEEQPVGKILHLVYSERKQARGLAPQ